jgi:enoyl-CoA hydratase/carnithine racemase
MLASEMNIGAIDAAGASYAFPRTLGEGAARGDLHPDKPARFVYTGRSVEPQRLAKVA